MTPKPLGLIAGSGALPQAIAHELQRKNIPFVMTFFEGISTTEGYPQGIAKTFALGKVGGVVAFLKDNHVQDLLISGYFPKPKLTTLRPDIKAAQWLAKLAFARGDNDYLTVLARLIEAEGLNIVNPDAYLENALTLPEGVATKTKPRKQHWNSLQRAQQVLQYLSPADVGQALIVEEQTVVAIEAAEGTNAMIERSTPYLHSGDGVMAKMCKAHQDLRLDRPTIGLQTLKAIHEAGLAGIFIDAQRSYVLDKQAVIDYANENKIFLAAVAPIS